MSTELCRSIPYDGASLKNGLHLHSIATGSCIHPQRGQHGKRVATVADRFDEHYRGRCLRRGVHQTQAAWAQARCLQLGTEFGEA